jgi:hypothetical protein
MFADGDRIASRIAAGASAAPLRKEEFASNGSPCRVTG